MTKTKRSPDGRGMTVAVVITLILVVGIVSMAGLGSKSTDESLAVFAARRGPLTISVSESGTIKAREQEVIKSQVEGQTQIIFLVPEGTRVKKGELLVELDTSSLEDKTVEQPATC